jgi:muconate cycloisomerase
LPLAVDEASVGPTEFLHYAAERLVDYLVIKLTRNGGVWPTVQQIAIAEAAGLPLLVSGLTESLLAKVAACQVAIVFGFAGPAALNGSQFLDESALYPDKPTIERGSTVYLPNAPGIGVRPDEAALQHFLVKDLTL